MKPSKPRHGNSEHSNRDNDDQHRAGDKRQIADQACPILDGIGKAVTQESSLSAPAPCGKNTTQKKSDILVSPAYTIAKHIVYARAERLLLDADDGPVVREDPGAPARREVRVRRCAENGARDTRHGRQWDAGEQQLNWEPEDRRVFSFTQKSTFSLARWDRKRAGVHNINLPANHGWMAAMRMLSAVTIGSNARIRPSTPCFEAEYCGAFIMPIQDAASSIV